MDRRMKVKAWLKGHENEAQIIELKGHLTEPIYPIKVKDYLCRMGQYFWKDYNRIRYERLNDSKED